MGPPEMEEEEPLTPKGRLLLRPEMNQIVHCAIGFEHSIDVDAIRSEISNSVMITHPRFSSLMVRDRCGREHWRKTQVNIDRHVIVRDEPVAGHHDDDQEAVNEYVADMTVSSPLNPNKPLWEIHLLRAHKCGVFRIHHALGDGTSLMSMLLTLCRRADDPDRRPTVVSMGASSSSSSSSDRMKSGEGWRALFWRRVKTAWLMVVFALELALRVFWVNDQRTAVSGGAGVELWPRKLATAKFRMDDMKVVKKAVAGATINDVLSGVISSGLSKYLDICSPRALREGLQITALAMVNLRKQPGLQDVSELMRGNSGSLWGNKFGTILFPVYYHKGRADDPLQYVMRAKAIMDQKKLAQMARFSYNVVALIMSTSYFLSMVAGWLSYRIVCNTTFTISNMLGPREEVTIAGNPVTYIRVNITSLPHAITMHMVSYGDRAEMQILVAKDIVPNPRLLAKCFEDALHEIKVAAEVAIRE